MSSLYSGSDWIKDSLGVKNISPLGIEVADLVGNVWRGIYHLPTSSLKKVEWSNTDTMSIVVSSYLSTWDSNLLTILVILSHDRMLRLEIEGVGPGYMRINFSKREIREGSTSKCLPTIEDHIKLIRNHYKV